MFKYQWAALAVLLMIPGAGAAAEPLDLGAAEKLAAARDVMAPRFEADAQALNERAVAEGQLPDPSLSFGVMSLPVDSFDRSEEPMTQTQIGVSQAFPPGKTLALSSERMQAMAGAAGAQADDQRRRVLRETRISYFELYHNTEAARIIAQSRALFAQLLEVTRAYYAAGRDNQQDVLSAGVELALLDDRETEIHNGIDQARAMLARWIGAEHAQRPLPKANPVLPTPPEPAQARERLAQHPMLRVDQQEVQASLIDVDIARQRYKPGWMLDVSYGDRTGAEMDGARRADMLTAMVRLDIPLFTAKRQDRVLAASQQEAHAAQLKRENSLYELEQMLDTEYANWRRLGERLELYRSQVLPQAEQNAEAALRAYQSGLADFTALTRARVMELDSRLMQLRLWVDREQSQARLLYLAGEPS